jgi:hypothetical protein
LHQLKSQATGQANIAPDTREIQNTYII